MRLAQMLGCTVKEAAERVTSSEYSDWLAYWNAFPPLEDRFEAMFATYSAMFASANGVKGAKPSNYMVSRASKIKVSLKEFISAMRGMCKK